MIKDTLKAIQQELKVPKGRPNRFGGYNYRNVEDIYAAIKPLLEKYDAALVLHDDVIEVGGRIYVKAVATLIDPEGERISVAGYAREQLERKKSDDSQLTGAASSYARKYALGGLFLIDDAPEDADSYEDPRLADDPEEELDAQEERERKPRRRKEPEPEELPFKLTLEEDTYYEQDGAFIMRRAGEDALLGARQITKEEYEAGSAEPVKKRRERKKR